jgi:hypothetical protein
MTMEPVLVLDDHGTSTSNKTGSLEPDPAKKLVPWNHFQLWMTIEPVPAIEPVPVIDDHGTSSGYRTGSMEPLPVIDDHRTSSSY